MSTTSIAPKVKKPDLPYALGMPYGSIRAILTLLIVAVVVYQLAKGIEVPVLWSETLMIALAHYFTSRRFIRLPPEVLRKLSDDGHMEMESRPLWLPRHSIRAMMLLIFGWLGYFLAKDHRLLEPESLAIIGPVFCYFLGVIIPVRQNRRWDNLKALVVLLTMGYVATCFLCGRADLVPKLIHNASLGLVLFYFGSR